MKKNNSEATISCFKSMAGYRGRTFLNYAKYLPFNKVFIVKWHKNEEVFVFTCERIIAGEFRLRL